MLNRVIRYRCTYIHADPDHKPRNMGTLTYKRKLACKDGQEGKGLVSKAPFSQGILEILSQIDKQCHGDIAV